jgi:threonine dehydrogenase-like Zn-dependent dehydrogenase
MGILQANGCFAEFVAVPVANLHLVPDSVTDEAAVFTEPLAAAYEILDQIHLRPSDTVLVLGDGKLGLLCAQILHSIGAPVRVVGKHARKLALLKKLGIDTMQLAAWQPCSFDLVVEATGSATGLQLAMQAVRPRGTLVLKSTIAAEHALSLAPLVINEVTVVGSRCGRFPPALQALAQARIAVTPLIDEIYPLAAGEAAVAHAARSGALKILLHQRP